MASKPRAKQNRAAAPLNTGGAPAARVPAIIGFLERRSRTLAVALILIASARIVSTYSVFSHTVDEPAHIACGIEWLAKGVYTWDRSHPPLERVAAALGPYLIGARPQNTPRIDAESLFKEGVAILFQGGHYDLTVTLARLGVLPFFWIACLVVYLWGLRCFGPAAAVIALFLFSFLPPVLAHAGLATTDMAMVAFLGAAFLRALIWTSRPTLGNGALFGLCAGLAVVSKFSALPYFPAVCAVALVCFYIVERPKLSDLAAAARQRIPSFGLAILTACVLIWAMYRFSFGPTDFGIRLPAPDLFTGIKLLMQHNGSGHAHYLLGRNLQGGVWYYFPLLLAVKTPIGFLPLLGFGIALAFQSRVRAQRAWLPLAFSGGVLLVGLLSNINLGVRHVLPVYMGFALLAAIAVVRLLEMAHATYWIGACLSVLILWFAGSSLLCHPDYLPYFNEFAGDHPEHIVVDSDLDWGQDMKRLAKKLNQEGADSFYMLPFLLELPQGAFGLPTMRNRVYLYGPMPGWNAISLTNLKERRLGLLDQPGIVPWPDSTNIPGERVGKGILLWYFRPSR